MVRAHDGLSRKGRWWPSHTQSASRALVALVALGIGGGGGVVGLGGCDKLAELLDKDKKKKWKTLEATDGRSRIRVPGSWEKADDLNQEASIQAQHLKRASFVLVITEDKGDFAPYSLRRYSDLVRKSMQTKSESYRETGPRKIEVGSRPALQYEVRAEVMGFKQRMLHTSVAGERYTHQILLWTNNEHWSAQRPVFDKIVASFREQRGAPRRAAPRAASVPLQRVTARSGRATVKIPKTWKELPKMNARADLRHGSQKENRYLMLITEPRAKVPKDLDLAGYAKVVFEQMSKRVQGFKKGKIQRIEIDGQPALQAVVRAQTGGVRLVYLITLLRSATHYHQLIIWSLPSQWDAVRPLYQRITRSLKVIPASSRPRAGRDPRPEARP